MSIQTIPVKVEHVLKNNQSAIIETSSISTSQIIALAAMTCPGNTLTIKSAYTITQEHLTQIIDVAAPGSVIFDFTR